MGWEEAFCLNAHKNMHAVAHFCLVCIYFNIINYIINHIDDMRDFVSFGLTLLTACLTVLLMYTFIHACEYY